MKIEINRLIACNYLTLVQSFSKLKRNKTIGRTIADKLTPKHEC